MYKRAQWSVEAELLLLLQNLYSAQIQACSSLRREMEGAKGIGRPGGKDEMSF